MVVDSFFLTTFAPIKIKRKRMGKLFVVPTPVGNMEDMTFRAIRVLKEADLILAEDTRTSSVLLHHYEIKNQLLSHHKFNEHQTVERLVERIKAGETVALISENARIRRGRSMVGMSQHIVLQSIYGDMIQ